MIPGSKFRFKTLKPELLEAEPGDYDPVFYREKLVGAAESILSPLGWSRDDIEKKMSGTSKLRVMR